VNRENFIVNFYNEVRRSDASSELTTPATVPFRELANRRGISTFPR